MLALPIVVGIDGGPASVAALQIALKEAGLRRTEVLAIICWPAEGRRDDGGPAPCDTHERATQIIEHVVAEATHHDPHHAPIVLEVIQGFPGPTLVTAAQEAELLVVGSIDRRPGSHHSSHSAVEHCLRYAATPVLVVPWTVARLTEPDTELDLRGSPAGS